MALSPADAACVRVIRDKPFYGSLLLQLNRMDQAQANQLIPTAAVYLTQAGTIGLAINDEFFATLTPKQQEAVIVHECLHVAFLHLERSFDDRNLGNLAFDLVVNQHTPDLPDHAVVLDTFNKSGHFKPPLEPNKTADYYYARLKERKDELQKDIDSGKIRIKVMDEHEWQNGQQCENGDQGNSPEKGGGMSDADKLILRSAAEQALREALKALKETGRQPGDVPAGLLREIEKSLEPQVDWRKELRRFVGDSIRIDTTLTRRRPNRRYGFDFPGQKGVYGAKILFVIDTSGSIGERELSQFIAEIDAASQRAEVVIMDCDCTVHSVYPYKRNKVPKPKGGGGTDFRPPFRVLSQQGRVPKADPSWSRCLSGSVDAVIYLTDGYGPFPAPKEVRWPVLWVMTTDVVGPFGKTVRINPGQH